MQRRQSTQSNSALVFKGAALSVALVVSLGAGAQVKAQDTRIFAQPPAAEELADILFPKRYRAIVLKNASQEHGTAEGQAEVFGLLVNFEFDSTVIVPQSLPLLDSVGEMLKLERVSDQAIVIEGHTDASGREIYNENLSERRARAVKRYLVSIFNIDPQRLVVEGKGERELYDAKAPKAPVNRRVQFKPIRSG
ncbi:MAG: OmpA family protein [Gammaproteobacteria bacterium]